MRYNQEACSRRNAEGHESFLIFRMIRIAAGGCQWIIENAHRLVKRNSMLAKVPGSLGGVPFEAHASLLSRENISRAQSHNTIDDARIPGSRTPRDPGHPPIVFSPTCNYFSQWILISWSSGLNSGSPVTSSAFFSLASAAAKASAKLILKRALKSAAVSANPRVVE